MAVASLVFFAACGTPPEPPAFVAVGDVETGPETDDDVTEVDVVAFDADVPDVEDADEELRDVETEDLADEDTGFDEPDVPPPNACGGSRELVADPGSPCGPCGDDEYECGPSGESVFCSGETTNLCGGCGALEGAAGDPCDGCGGGGVLVCAPDGSSLICQSDLTNACGGCEALLFPPGTPCGQCGLDAYECSDDLESVQCSGSTTNLCGGCGDLVAAPGDSCGRCGLDVYECRADGSGVVCSGNTQNACGGCPELEGKPGDDCGGCGTGTYACGSFGDSVYCRDDTTNACGGCNVLDNFPGQPCGPCALDMYVCSADGTELICDGSTENACGGCSLVRGAPGDACIACGSAGEQKCSPSGERLFCESPLTNACGGCSELSAEPGASCEDCEGSTCVYECDREGGLRCFDPDGFTHVASGTMMMGVGEWNDSTYPKRLERLTRDFYIQTHEVTQGQWTELMGTVPFYFPDCGPQCPVEHVNWWDALAYANALSLSVGLEPCYELVGCVEFPEACPVGRTDCGNISCDDIAVNAPDGNPYLCEGFRLPTESEWEYAARAGDDRSTYIGDVDGLNCAITAMDTIAWYCGNSEGRPHPVGQKLPNSFGLHDVLGNVQEWTWDSYGGALGNSPRVDPAGVTTALDRVVRGWNFFDRSHWIHVGVRARWRRESFNHQVGFRLARTVPGW